MKELMKRIAILLTLALTLITAACGGDTKLPDATGKASIRAINAIKTAPSVAFRIEERLISEVSYQGSSNVSEYDDLDYTFSIDVGYAGENSLRRIASQYIDFVADQEYTLLLSGTLADPELTLWEIAQREFTADETVFQIRFSHNSEYLETTGLDYYLALTGVAPAAGAAVATAAFGELSPPIDIEVGNYALTITSANNPGDIRFTSDEFAFTAGSDLIISPFDAVPSRTSPFTVHIFGVQGGSAEIADSAAAPITVEFLHASSDLGTVHIYDDEGLSSQVLADHMYTDLSPQISIVAGDNTFRYTPTDTSAVLVEGDLPAVAGFRYRFVVTGVNTAFTTSASVPDTRPLETSAKLLISQASNNFDFMAFYVVDSGEIIGDTNRLAQPLSTDFPNATAGVPAGDYDIYVTAIEPTDILAGPISLSVALGDVVDIMIFDDPMDPAVLDLQILSGP